MADERKPAYWAVIPAKVRYDTDLRPNAKLLYAEISALADSTGYCWASNESLGALFGISGRTVRELVSDLAEKGYIKVEVVRDERTHEVKERRIWAGIHRFYGAPPSGEKSPDPSGENPPDPSGEKSPEEQSKINSNSIPPIVPQNGGRVRKGKYAGTAPKTAPDWQSERFAKFWKAYPRGENKQAAIRAWDKLRPDEGLMDQMSVGLARALDSRDWKRGIGIPHASTWINQRRWEDEQKAPPNVSDPDTGRRWADDPEVI